MRGRAAVRSDVDVDGPAQEGIAGDEAEHFEYWRWSGGGVEWGDYVEMAMTRARMSMRC
jgi:hypothetical protein